MSRYADIEPIIKKIKYSMGIGEIRGRIWFEMVLADLEKLPTIDAVPVVRCSECKFNPRKQGVGWVSCPMTGKGTRKEDDFCSYGEKVTE